MLKLRKGELAELLAVSEEKWEEECPGMPLADYLAECIENFESIQRSIVDVEKVIHGLKQDIKQKAGNIEEFQQSCSHPVTQYHADPSGGHDSHRACLICKFEF
jgi:hypothetical protein